MIGEIVWPSKDLTGQNPFLTGHCPLTGRYFKPWETGKDCDVKTGPLVSWQASFSVISLAVIVLTSK